MINPYCPAIGAVVFVGSHSALANNIEVVCFCIWWLYEVTLFYLCFFRLLETLRRPTTTTPVASASSSRSTTRRVAPSEGETQKERVRRIQLQWIIESQQYIKGFYFPQFGFYQFVLHGSLHLNQISFFFKVYWLVYTYLQSLRGKVPAREITPGVPGAQREVRETRSRDQWWCGMIKCTSPLSYSWITDHSCFKRILFIVHYDLLQHEKLFCKIPEGVRNNV